MPCYEIGYAFGYEVRDGAPFCGKHTNLRAAHVEEWGFDERTMRRKVALAQWVFAVRTRVYINMVLLKNLVVLVPLREPFPVVFAYQQHRHGVGVGIANGV